MVVIGRNEGSRFVRCLESLSVPPSHALSSFRVDRRQCRVRSLAGVIVVELAQDRPFTAARARNAGHRALLERWPRLRMVQFVDGDCEIAPGWLERATDVLMERDDVGVACGRRRESSEANSITACATWSGTPRSGRRARAAAMR